jgi:hypothetical protein
MLNVIISIKYARIKVEDLVLKHVDDLQKRMATVF